MQAEQRHAQRGVQDFGLDAVDILILDALDRIPSARARGLVALVLIGVAEERLELLAAAACGKSAGDRERRDVGRDEEELALGLALDDLGRAIAPFAIEACGPEVGRFHHVGIGGDDTNRCRCHGDSLQLDSVASKY